MKLLESARKSTEWFLNRPGVHQLRQMDEESGRNIWKFYRFIFLKINISLVVVLRALSSIEALLFGGPAMWLTPASASGILYDSGDSKLAAGSSLPAQH